MQETLVSWRFYLTKYFVVEKKSNYFKIWFNSKECFPFKEKKNLYLLRPNCIINSVLFLYLNWQIHKLKYISFYFNTFSKVLKTKMSNNTFPPNFWIITKLEWLWTQWKIMYVCPIEAAQFCIEALVHKAYLMMLRYSWVCLTLWSLP